MIGPNTADVPGCARAASAGAAALRPRRPDIRRRWRYRVAIAVALLPVLIGFAHTGRPVMVFLAGDSTMAQKTVDRRPETGWGEALQQYFDSDRVRVQNHARNGRSTRSFIAEGRWDNIVLQLAAGDYVLIQFGHNDAAVDRTDRYTPPDEFRDNLVRFIEDVRAQRATPVLLTPVMRRRFNERGELYDAHGEYPDIVRSVAAEHSVALLDMHRDSEAALRRYGADRSRALFLHLRAGEHVNYPEGLRDDTHFSPAGAELMAELAVRALRRAQLPLAAQLVADRSDR